MFLLFALLYSYTTLCHYTYLGPEVVHLVRWNSSTRSKVLLPAITPSNPIPTSTSNSRRLLLLPLELPQPIYSPRDFFQSESSSSGFIFSSFSTKHTEFSEKQDYSIRRGRKRKRKRGYSLRISRAYHHKDIILGEASIQEGRKSTPAALSPSII